MALNLKTVATVTAIPSRVRGGVENADKERIYKEFFELIDMARAASDEAGEERGVGPATVAGESECNKYANALGTFKTDHPNSWACLNTAGNIYTDDGKMVEMRLYAAAKPQERKLARLAKKAG